jgi:hypothetical protein
MQTKTFNGGALAAMVAGLFAMTAATSVMADDHPAGDQAAVKCMNSSSCKGHGACKQASNACKGKNACKGQGFTMQKSQQDCTAAQDAAKQAG